MLIQYIWCTALKYYCANILRLTIIFQQAKYVVGAIKWCTYLMQDIITCYNKFLVHWAQCILVAILCLWLIPLLYT